MRRLMLGLSLVVGPAVVGFAQEPPSPSATASQGQAFEVATVKRNTSAPETACFGVCRADD